MFLLGYDIGSSSIKAAIVDAATQKTVAVEAYPDTEMDMLSRQTGWAEQSPEVWWQHLCAVTRRILAKTGIKSTEIKAIGISYQMHGLVAVGSDGQVLRPAIIWCDSRAVEIGREAFHSIGEAKCLAALLNSPGNFTASKLRWVKDNEPDIFRRIHKILLPGEWVAFRMTGEAATTIPGLSEGIFWDFEKGQVSTDVLEHFGFLSDILPQIVPVFAPQGRLTREAADQMGLRAGIEVTYRAGDQPNNALALNVIRPGEVAATCGTSGVVYGIFDRPIFDPKSRINAFAHVNHTAEKPRIGALLCINGAGIEHAWMRQQIARDGATYLEMEGQAAAVPIGSDGLCLLPFGNGSERMFEDETLNAHLFNLQFNRHTRAHLFRASLEGVAFSFVHGLQILKEIGLAVDVLRVGNDNMFQSRVFAETIATLLNIQIEVVETTGAVGAARAAGVGAGIFPTLEAALEGIRPVEIFEPKLHRGNCLEAYNYWNMMLENVLAERGLRPAAHDRFRQSQAVLKKELEAKSQETEAARQQILIKNALLEQVRQQIEAMQKKAETKSAAAELQKIARKMEADAGEKSGALELLEKRFSLAGDPFLAKMRVRFPSLSGDELQLCALLKLHFRSKELAQHFHISVRGIETRRYRLRKKLGLATDAAVVAFLEDSSF